MAAQLNAQNRHLSSMPSRTVNQGFEKFHSDLIPSGYASGKAASHKASITSRLETHFDLRRLFYSGSANNGTSIANYSDVDFFASIPTGKLKKNSATSLREIKECLQGRYPNSTIYVDSPAVVVNFGYSAWDTAEIIPADYVTVIAGKNTYEMPNTSGGWMQSSPGTHTKYVADENIRLKSKLKPLIRFVKAWKYFCNVPISSFYLELRVTKWMESEDSILYEFDLKTIFATLESCGLAAMRDPKGISGLVQACSSDVKKASALSKVRTAATRAQKAREAESANDTKSAFYWWNLLFDGNFPNYYY